VIFSRFWLLGLEISRLGSWFQDVSKVYFESLGLGLEALWSCSRDSLVARKKVRNYTF